MMKTGHSLVQTNDLKILRQSERRLLFAVPTVISVVVLLSISLLAPLMAYADPGTFVSGPYANSDYGINIQLPKGYPAVESNFNSAFGNILAVTVGFKSETGTTGYDFDGASMDVMVFPSANFPIPYTGKEPTSKLPTGLECHVSDRRLVGVNEHTTALKVSSDCVGFDSDTFSDSYWIQGKDKVVQVQYRALDDFAYRIHLPEFQNSLATINVG